MNIRKTALTLGASSLMFVSLAIAGSHTEAPATNPTPANQTAAMQLTISQLQANRQQVVAENLPLTAGQAEDFWNLYREFSNERAKLVEQEVKLILDFRNNFDNLSEDQAKALLDNYLKIETQSQKLTKKYINRYRKVLTQTQTLRYFQIENKLDDILAFEMAQVIPLAY